jgi:hypothetical protein
MFDGDYFALKGLKVFLLHCAHDHLKKHDYFASKSLKLLATLVILISDV